jgi:hypothetical protein
MQPSPVKPNCIVPETRVVPVVKITIAYIIYFVDHSKVDLANYRIKRAGHYQISLGTENYDRWLDNIFPRQRVSLPFELGLF